MTTFLSTWFTGLGPWAFTGWKLAQILGFVGVVMISIAFLMYADRKIWASVQLRKGPNVVGPFGLAQSFADFIKFVLKEVIIPAGADKPVFLLAPLVAFSMALIGWAVVPAAPGWVVADINVGVLYLLAVSSLGVYGVIMGGWASNSKYPFLGSLRSAAQMVSYEVSIGLILLTVVLLAGSLNLTEIVMNQATEGGNGGFWRWHAFQPATIVIMFPMFVIFFISALAETNRPPFDLPEAESELVAGYQVEYSSAPFLLLFAGELVAITLMCAMTTVLFLGGWHAPFPLPNFPAEPTWWTQIWHLFWFVAKALFVFFLFSMVKAIVPRYRYDQLMRLGWKIFLPTSLAAVMIVAAYVTLRGPAA